MIEPVTRIPPLARMDRVQRDKHKITALPLKQPQVKRKEKSNTEHYLSPWLIALGFVLAVALLNGLIGG